MKKIITSKIENSCGKKGCKLYVLPFGSTKEAFDKFVDFCVKDQSEEEKQILEIENH